MQRHAMITMLLSMMLLFMVGCPYAEWVEKTSTGGIIQVPDNIQMHREEAFKMADAEWGSGNWKLIKEERVKEGEYTSSSYSESEHTSRSGRSTYSSGSGSSRTSNVYHYNLHFQVLNPR